MKVINFVGYPIDWAPGGHRDQIRNTLNALRELGVDIYWLHNEEQNIEEKYDIIHFWSTPPTILVNLARQRGLKCVFSTMLPTARYGNFSKLINKWLLNIISLLKIHPRITSAFENIYKKMDALIVLNEVEKEHFQSIWKVPKEKIYVIPNGIDKIFFNNNLEPIKFNGILMVGYICDVKNSLEVAQICRKNKIKIKFIGDFRLSDKEYIKTFLNEIDNINTFWLGHLEKEALIAHIKGSNGLILPSKYEAQGLVVLEASVLNKPILLTDLPTLRLTYKNFNNIFYCHPRNKKLFEKEIIEFYNNVKDKHEIKNKNRILSWEDVGIAIYDIYKKILNENT